MDPLSTGISITSIYGLISSMSKLNASLKFNKAQCEFLMQRVYAIQAVVTTLDTLKLTKEKRSLFECTLRTFKATLEKAHKLIKIFTKRTSFQFAKHILWSQSYGPAFQSIHNELSTTLADLQFNLVTQQLHEIERLQTLLKNKEDCHSTTCDKENTSQEYSKFIQQNREALKQLENTLNNFPMDKQEHPNISDQVELLKKNTENIEALANKTDLSQAAEDTSENTINLPGRLTTSPDENDPGGIRYKKIAWHELSLGGLIAEGNTGALYKGIYQEKKAAIKLVDQQHRNAPKQRQEILDELRIMTELDHPNITQLHGAYVDEQKVALVMEYMETGDLSTVIKSKTLDLATKHQIALETLEGLHYLHEKRGIIHHKLSSRHVLLDDHYRAKLTNFSNSITQVSTLQGTVNHEGLVWMAPEEIQDLGKSSNASDTYRFGLLLWSLLTGKAPFEGLEQTQAISRIKESPGQPEDLSALPANLSGAHRQLILACWEPDPSKRINDQALMDQLKALPAKQKEARDQYYKYAKEYAQGLRFTDKDPAKEALTHYQRAADMGHPKAWHYIGVFYMHHAAKTPVYSKAYHAFLEGAKHDDPKAMRELAIMLETGDATDAGVQKDETEALHWYRRAAKSGIENCAERAEKLEKKLKEKTNPQAAAFLY